MNAVHAYRRQHGEIAATINTLSELLRDQDAVSRTFDIRAVLNELSSKLDDHLALEDRVLYPRLLEHGDARVRAAAAELQGELSGLHAVCDQYFAAWSSVSTIAARFHTFRFETRAVMARLQDRMRREDEELGPALEQ